MRRTLGLLLAAIFCLSSQDLPPEVLALARIRDRVREAVNRLPDCTCIETVTRFVTPPGKDPHPLDRIVLQILFSGSEELFASPGATRWESSPFGFLGGGLMGNGLFALHLRSIFLNNQSIIRYHGMENASGHTEARYDFAISRMLSGYSIRRGDASGVVAMRGSFWTDPRTYDLRRIAFHAEEIPPELGYADISTAISYGRMRIGESDVLLPQTADLSTTGEDGEKDRDVIEFTQCQGFHAESTLSFGAGADAASGGPKAAPPAPLVEGTLPPDLRIVIALSSPVNDGLAVGSLLEGKVAGAVTRKGKVFVPDGALAKGRVRRLERYSDDGDYFIVALEFIEIEMPGAELRFYAGLEDVDHAGGVDIALGSMPGGRARGRSSGRTPADAGSTEKYLERIWTHEVPGVGTFFIRGSHFSLPAGFQTIWKTQPYPRSATP